jgi:glycosyltransferase involved in cell wall biosynthesis
MSKVNIGSAVSIITPTFNHEQFVGPCVESVIGQSYSNWEQIVIDDGSTDNTVEAVSRFPDLRVRLHRQENQGPFELAKTYNRALALAKGELVAILEGDDFWPPDKLAALVPAFADDSVVLAYGEAADVDAKGSVQRRKSHTARLRKRLLQSVLSNNPVGTATRHMLFAEGRSLVSPCTVVIRRRALEQIGGFQNVRGLPLTDYPTFLELSLLGRFHYSPQTMGYRRRHLDSITVKHERKIHQMVSEFTMAFLESHVDRIPLPASDREAILRNWRQAEDRLDFSEGRSLMLQQSWSEARRHFRAASKSKNATVRIAASVGFFLSWLHIDIEPLMKLGGRAGLRRAN